MCTTVCTFEVMDIHFNNTRASTEHDSMQIHNQERWSMMAWSSEYNQSRQSSNRASLANVRTGMADTD